MDNSYDVYIGNLSATVSLQRLKNLFFEVGKILFGWIKLNNKIVTFGFIAFEHLADAKKALLGNSTLSISYKASV